MSLSAFLNPIQEDTIYFAVSKRFLDEKKNPILWEMKSISVEEDEALRKKCMVKTPISGKKGQFTQEFDGNQYMVMLATACTVFPNLNSAQLQDGYGAMGAEALLKKMLKPGEFADYCAKVQEVNGYAKDMDELVGEAKN